MAKKQMVGAAPSAADENERIARENEGMMWTHLVSAGSVIVKRVNELRALNRSLLTAAIAIAIGSIALFAGGAMDSSAAVSGWQVSQSEINKWAAGATVKSPAAGFKAATASDVDYSRFIAQVLGNPSILVQQSGGAVRDGTIPCVPFESLAEPWVNPATGVPDRPRCKFSGDNIFVASYVTSGRDGKQYPILGIFHKGAASWDYYNFDGALGDNIYRFGDRKNVTIYQVADSIDKAFPGALIRGDLTKPRTAWGFIKKQFNKIN
jgi:hypothetical protein